ncbi:Uncharacterized conserved protein, DUF885 familyt [Lentzea xinjiangensis]|uniref:Uncharacterized conserved protein, DUF885 familyt n=1 Tax=Lentzea xinjiangensis TaxID=402600 RepID=A0A1H9U6X7_9PSEU|nr:DUF885 domain-containing protein [Lentzea xinjiangensis]SES05072.1 Uncharacterized conserved protein, DUF885 familyt [Lentzea xinjiangensis]
MTTDTLASFLSWYFEHHPAHAAQVGSLEHSSTFGDFSATAFERRAGESGQWRARLEALPRSVDRDLALSVLCGSLALQAWPAWRRDPSEYSGVVFFGLLAPFLHRLLPETGLVDAAVAKLREVPSVLAAAEANLDPSLASPLVVRRALGRVRTGRAFVLDSLPGQVSSVEQRARLVEAAVPAAEAFDRHAAFLDDLALRATGDWRMGEQLYSTLLQDRELLGYGAPELHRRGQDAYAELEAELIGLAGSSDWRAAMSSLQDDHPPTLAAMRAEYEAETARARAALVEHSLVTLPEGEKCHVVPSPPFERAMMSVASYLGPPPLTSRRTGYLFVPFTLDGATDEQISHRLRTNARAQLPTIAVHEAYPGHHWHAAWLAAQGPAHPLRKVFRTSYFSEGWALYAEKLLRSVGHYTTTAALMGHVEARLFRAARMIVDTSLHCGDMTPAEAEAFMVARTALTPGTAAGEVQRYCAWPTQAPSYLTGALEIEQIRDEYLAAGLGTVRDFHDRIAGSGALPLGLARRVALGED